MNYSYFNELRCSVCQKSYDPRAVQTYCPDCQAPLVAGYDLAAAGSVLDRLAIAHRSPGMWRWHELLPVFEPANVVDLGEGDTPLLRLPRLGEELGLPGLYVKEESLNPTGTFKARGLAAAVSKAKELGLERLIIPTAGNAGGALAAYAARAGLQAYIFMPRDTPLANLIEARMAGATVELVDGLINDAAALAQRKADAEGWFDVSTFKEPYRLEGKKVMGYELAQQFGWALPEVVVYPTGGGTGLVGMWKAFAELAQLGWLESDRRPRMVVVQGTGCAPVVAAFESGAQRCEFWQNAETIASGLRVPRSFADRLILETLYASQGTAVAISDADIAVAQRRLSGWEGLFAAPEGAATLAAVETLLAQGWIQPHERVVLFNTGTGLKYLEQAQAALDA